MLGDVGLVGLDAEAEFADVFDDLAEVVLVISDELGVFFLLVEEDARFVLFAGELPFEFGDAGGWEVDVREGRGLGIGLEG